MGALWNGILTANRWTLACPECGNLNARADCDSLGRTLIICSCRPAPFLLKVTVGGQGLAWPIDVSGCDREDEHDAGDVPTRSDLGPRSPRRHRCINCPRAVGPRSVHCAKCAPIFAAQRFPCSTLGCDGTRSYKAERCDDCAKIHRTEQRAEYRRQRVRA